MQNDSIKLSDAEIIRQVVDGDVNAFESLMTRHKDMVLRIVKRHVPYSEVEDVAQNSFIRVFEALATFRGKGGFKQWLSAITVRTCYDYWRKVYRSKEISMSSLTEKHMDWLEEVISDRSESEVQDKGEQKEAAELLDWALANLSAEDRMVVELVYLEGLTGKEAADLLGWSLSNVKVRAFRSRKRLKKLLKDTMKR
ncbi:MAG TPA: RNA polymerase sigma factor [Desulfatiglandales bacterium]|nr:RNA polymerase sigma factor [Desulfatiglandales bacterium]